ncbi:MAG: dihydrodipicolinate synthase family protein, partial [Chloroflexota bacterium]
MPQHELSGVYAAAVTPLKNDFSPDIRGLNKLLEFLAQRGCHGALLLGTTGEGPSFSTEERKLIWQTAAQARKAFPEFRLMAGTGSPSISETINLNNAAFDFGFDAVVTLPPYYYRNATETGLHKWFEEVIEKSVPEDRVLLGYHIPQVT